VGRIILSRQGTVQDKAQEYQENGKHPALFLKKVHYNPGVSFD